MIDFEQLITYFTKLELLLMPRFNLINMFKKTFCLVIGSWRNLRLPMLLKPLFIYEFFQFFGQKQFISETGSNVCSKSFILCSQIQADTIASQQRQ